MSLCSKANTIVHPDSLWAQTKCMHLVLGVITIFTDMLHEWQFFVLSTRPVMTSKK